MEGLRLADGSVLKEGKTASECCIECTTSLS